MFFRRMCRIRSLSRVEQVRNLCCDSAGAVGVYLHWPYCRKKCTYCNFNKYISKDVDYDRMLRCLTAEWRSVKTTAEIPGVKTIYFGGGTPSLMPPWVVEELIKEISRDSRGDVEVSLEGNPGDLVGRVKDLQLAGVNRLSIGVQALRDVDLQLFNRDHTVVEALTALEESLAVFPGATSADLIFGRPGQGVEDWLGELAALCDLGLPHLSMYQLTVERGTRLWGQVKGGQVQLPEEEQVEDMYLRGVQLLESRGLLRYEVSNFGAESEHNTGYWTGRPYVGLGPGAHSRLGLGAGRRALVNRPSPRHWMEAVEARGQGVATERSLDCRESVAELLACGLRRRKGVTREAWSLACGDRLCLDEFLLSAGRHGVLATEEGVGLSGRGIAVLDSLLPHLFVILDELKLK